MTRRTLLLVLGAVTLAVSAWRLAVLAETEPRYDQAFFAWWLRLLAESSHILPVGTADSGWLQALKADEGSLLHQLLRNLYNKPTSLLTLLPIGVMGAVTTFLPSYQAQTAVSILWAGLLLPIVGGFGWWGRGAGPVRHATGLVAMGLVALNPTLFWVSPLGIHNFGLVGLMAALAATEARLGRLARGESSPSGTEAGIHLLAYFSHWTNAFLLPAAALASRWAAASPGRRVRAATGYLPVLLVVGLSLTPLVAVEALRPAEDHTHSLLAVARMTTQPGSGSLLHALTEGSRAWLSSGAETLSWPGLITALAGVGMLWRRGIRSPALLILVHFALYAVMPGFHGASHRVFPYVIAPLCLGLAEVLVSLFQWRRLAALALAALAAAPLLPVFAGPPQMAQARPEFWRFYYQGQGELRPMIAEMEQLVPPDGVLLSWSYGILVVHGALRSGPPIPVALDGLWLRHDQRRLKAYLESKPPVAAKRLFLATEDAEITRLSPPMAETLPALLGPEGLDLRRQPRLAKVAQWHLTGSSPGDVTLWEVLDDAP